MTGGVFFTLPTMQHYLRYCLLPVLLMVVSHAVAETVYRTAEEFVDHIYPQQTPAVATLWLDRELMQRVEDILQHPYHKLRLRYWLHGKRSAWILEEIGKERYITAGIVVNDNAIEDIEILTYRESRGSEVRHDFFTRQFKGMTLTETGQLSSHIDGITGATLSVRAVNSLARLALLLHRQVMADNS